MHPNLVCKTKLLEDFAKIKLSAVILGFIKTGEDLDIKNTKPTVGEGMSPLPLSLPNEAHPHEYLHRESDTAERSFRLHASLPRIAIREKFVSCYLLGYIVIAPLIFSCTFHYRVSFQESIALKQPNFRKNLVK